MTKVFIFNALFLIILSFGSMAWAQSPCGISTLPFTDGFESYPSSSLPDCYVRLTDVTNPNYAVYPRVSSNSSHSGSKSIQCYGTGDHYLVLPQILDTVTHPLNTLQVSMWIRDPYSTNTVTVGAMTCDTLMSTFTAAQSHNGNNTWTQYTFYLTNIEQGSYIAIKIVQTGNSDAVYLDDIEITAAPTCSPIPALTAYGVAGSSATLAWESSGAGDADSYTVVISDLDLGSATSFTTNDTVYPLTDLTQLTHYRAGVLVNCTNGMTSDTVFTEFTTTCYNPVDATIGMNGGTEPHLPTYISSWKYSYTQQIFPASLFDGTATDFMNIGLQYAPVGNVATRQLIIFAANVPNGTTLENDWVLPANVPFQQVYAGSYTFSHDNLDDDGWLRIDFDSAFHYDGTSDVLLAVLDTTGNYQFIGYAFRGYSDNTTENLARYAHSNSAAINYTTPDTGTAYNYRNYIKFGYCDPSSCIRPHTLTVSDVTSSSAEVAWTAVGSEGSWELQYRAATDSVWTYAGTTGSNPFTLSGLQDNTIYGVQVRAVCGETDVSAWSEQASFRTLCGAISQLPYTETFDETFTDNGTAWVPCWSRLSDTATHYVHYSSNINYNTGGTGALNFGQTPGGYTVAVSPEFDSSLPLNTLMVTFAAARTSGSSQGTFEVGVMTSPSDYSTYESYTTIAFDEADVWEEKTVYFNSYTGDGQYVAFRAAGSADYYYVLDSVAFDYLPACMPALSLAATNVTTDAATITWSGTAGEYAVTVISGADTTEYNVTTENLELTSLMPGAGYTVIVQAICGSDSAVLSTPFTFFTHCDAITVTNATPWTENFEAYAGNGAVPLSSCWVTPLTYTANNGTFPAVYTNYAPATYSGLNSLEIKGDTAMVVLPQFTNDLNTLRLSMWGNTTAWSANYAGTMEIGYVTDPNNPATFVVTDTIPATAFNRTGTDAPHADQMGPFSFENVIPDSTQRIALRYTNFSTYYSWNLDDINVSILPACPSPVKNSVTAANVSINSALISWVDFNSSHTAWTVYYKSASEATWQTAAATDTAVTLTNLTEATVYQVYVVTDCGTVEEYPDATNTIQFQTAQSPATLPYTANFANSGEWKCLNGVCANYWTTGVADSANNTYGMFITNNGTTIGYSTGSYSAVSAEKLFTVGTSDEIEVEFDVRAGGENTHDWMKLFLAPATMDYTAGTSQQFWTETTYSTYAYNFSDYLSQTGQTTSPWKINLTQGNTIHVTAVMANPTTSPDANAQAKVVFAWKNDNSYGTQPGAVITNVSVRAVTCNAPTTPTVYNVTSNSADLSWGAPNTQSTWNLQYKTEASSIWTPVVVTGNSVYTLTGLTPETTYNVRVQADCGDSDVSVWTAPVSFTTEQASSVVDPTVETNSADNITQTSATLHGTVTDWGNQTPIAQGFEWKTTAGGTYTQTPITTATTMSYNLTGLTANTGYTFRAFVTTANGTVYGSELTFTTLPEDTPEPCDTPTGLDTTAVLNETVSVTWDFADVYNWNLRYRPQNGEWTTATATANTYPITGLSVNTTYEIQVQAVCEEGNVSEWSPSLFVTTTNVGIEDRLAGSVSLYPNPTTDVLNVQCTRYHVQGVEIVDVYGKIIRAGVETLNPASPQTVQIDVAGMAAGMYFVRVTTDAGTVTKTFVKK